ncbi:TonB-dependent receptor plug domain-containing protein [Robiginitalea sediminis]|uniref:TonB-dependent receptor plug domain-containing protein n=1 Tax=Robiginitalea sediminis TaxID=1982593 RepID=UPI000B4AC9E0|nr:TonB-dependent receptor [Robiginitalea sediminis]
MKTIPLAVGALLLAVAPSLAQTGPDSTVVTQLDEVVLTDTRLPLPRAQSGKAVIRLDAKALEAYQGGSVADVLNRQSGFEIGGGRGRPGEVLGVYARGGRGRQVLVLIDGVRVTDPSSFSQEYDLRLLALDQVASIEILKGASSTLYGTNAAAAVIDIRTRKPSEKALEGQVRLSAGTQGSAEDRLVTFGRYTAHVGAGGRSGAFHYQANVSYQLSNGLSSLDTDENEKDPYRNLGFNTRVGWDLSEKTEIGIFADRTRVVADYDDAFNGLDAPFEFQTDQERLGVRFRHSAAALKLEGHMAYAAYSSENRSDFPSAFSGGNWTGELLARRSLGENTTLLGGIGFNRDRADLQQPESFTFVDPFINLVWQGPGGLNLSGGARLNLHSEYGTKGVYQLNPSWRKTTDTGYLKVFASWSTAYITPTLNQLFGAFGANPDLEPETNRTLEFGLEGRRLESLRWTLLYFNREETGAVIFDNAQSLYFNAADPIRVSGVEAEVRFRAAKGWWLTGNYTFTERKGDAAIRIPKHKFNAGLEARLGERWEGLLTYSFTGARPDTDFSTFTPVELEAFSLVDLRISHQVIPDRLRAFLALGNLFNTEFTEVLGFQAPGRTVQTGLSLNW